MWSPGLLSKTSGQMFDGLQGSNKLTIKEEGAWLEIEPSNPDLARHNRADRQALGQFVRSALFGSPLLDCYVRYALAVDQPGSYSLTFDDQPASCQFEAVYLALGAPHADISMVVHWAVLRFLGLLDSSQRKDLENGIALHVSELSSVQLQALTSVMFGPAQYLHKDHARFDATGACTDREPTDLLSDGIPASCTVSMSVEIEN